MRGPRFHQRSGLSREAGHLRVLNTKYYLKMAHDGLIGYWEKRKSNFVKRGDFERITPTSPVQAGVNGICPAEGLFLFRLDLAYVCVCFVTHKHSKLV